MAPATRGESPDFSDEGGVQRPLLVVMEEAHRYLGPDAGTNAVEMVKRIAKEGRKYVVGAMVISQRPAEQMAIGSVCQYFQKHVVTSRCPIYPARLMP